MRKMFWFTAFLLGVALLALCGAAWGDSIENLSGTKHAPGTVYIYSFQVDEFTGLLNPDGSTYIEDILNGSVLTRAASFGCKPCTTTYVNDIFQFLPTESVILAQFGNWDLIGSASGVALRDPVATPEPMTLVLLFAGALWLWALALKPREKPQARAYLGHHAFRKGAQ